MESDLKSLILHTKQPLILKNYLKWPIFQWNLHKWTEILDDSQLEFRCGVNANTEAPQWERSSQIILGKFEDLTRLSGIKKWLYFDYKYMKDWFLNAKEFRQAINFKDLGLQTDVNNSTIWIGTKGAHTPCHTDTYGCNVVVQIYGQKQWLLFPPNQDLKPSRIPYEESSIYSQLNFFSPNNLLDFKDITNCRIVTLNPGDVLIVPLKWWHYVENLELSISINTWLPLEQDDEERQTECLVQILMATLTKILNKKQWEIVLNPNFDDLLESSPQSGIEVMNNLLEISKAKDGNKTEMEDFKVEELCNKYEFITRIPVISKQEFDLFLEQKSKRFSNTVEKKLQTEITAEKLVHAITHPDVIELIMNKLK